MNYKISKSLLNSKYRQEMWHNAKKIVRQLDKVLPVQAAYLTGSFSTKKSALVRLK